MMKPPYRCLYNHELLILFTTETPWQSYRQPVSDEQVVAYISELQGTGVDCVTICPQAWMTNLWPSQIDPRWSTPPAATEDRLPEEDLKYYEKVHQRISRYMRQGRDPVAQSIASARSLGLAPFLSYRMNENHYTQCADAPTHSAFWRDHPEFQLQPTGSNLNFLLPEVRAHQLALICELIDHYDIDGFECDFMRQAVFFPPDKVAEGAELMTDLVRQIRRKLDAAGQARGRHLYLGVRVPHHLGSDPAALAAADPHDLSRQRLGVATAGDVGLDVRRWDREGVVDLVNVSSSFYTTPDVDIAGYRAALSHAAVYGELHFISQLGRLSAECPIQINRLTNREYYRSTALSYLERGADGISLFNFAYTREHSFRDPRRQCYPGVEPPFDVIPSLTRPDDLRAGDQHICWISGYGGNPTRDMAGQSEATFELYLPDCFQRPFSRAILRLEADDRITHRPVFALVNGRPTEVSLPNGELFPPLSLEALPDRLHLRQFAVPLDSLRPGLNHVTVQNQWRGEGGSGYFRGRIRLLRVELALYR